MNNPHFEHGNSNFAVMLTVAIALAVAIVVGVNIMYGPPKAGSAAETEIAARVAPVGSANTSGQPATVTNPAAGAAAPAAKPAETAAAAPAPAAAPAEAPAAAPAAAATAMTGEETFKKVCSVCHQAGIAGAPKFGDAAAWAPRIAQGKDLLHQHALEGFAGQAGMMPPRGGMATLKDEEVKAAVDYMVEAAGGPKAEAAAPAAAAPAAAAAEKPAEAAAAAPAATAQAAAGGDEKGKKTFDGTCYVCHATGAAGAPKFGDAGAWGPRIAQGKDMLYKHALEGFMGQAGMMPPRGGRPDLSDDDVKAAVDYMAAAASK